VELTFTSPSAPTTTGFWWKPRNPLQVPKQDFDVLVFFRRIDRYPRFLDDLLARARADSFSPISFAISSGVFSLIESSPAVSAAAVIRPFCPLRVANA
jgi:hypothetical protein